MRSKIPAAEVGVNPVGVAVAEQENEVGPPVFVGIEGKRGKAIGHVDIKQSFREIARAVVFSQAEDFVSRHSLCAASSKQINVAIAVKVAEADIFEQCEIRRQQYARGKTQRIEVFLPRNFVDKRVSASFKPSPSRSANRKSKPASKPAGLRCASTPGAVFS